jgi:DNA-binding IclR family transcriptional regulator
MPSLRTATNAAATGGNDDPGEPRNGGLNGARPEPGGTPGEPDAAPRGPGGTQSGQRLLAVLDQFTAGRPVHTVEQLSQAVGVPRSTVYRLVGLLRAHGLVEQAGDGRYRLGPKAIMIGYVARSTVDLADLWRPGLQELAALSRETVLVLRRIEDSAVCIDRIDCDHPIRLSFDVGRAMPLHTGAGAKVLLATSPAGVRDRYLERAVPAGQRAALRADLDRIADRQWGESRAEVDPGIWAVGAPVLADRDGRCLAISVAVPEYRLEAGRRAELITLTKGIAAELRARLSQYA